MMAMATSQFKLVRELLENMIDLVEVTGAG